MHNMRVYWICFTFFLYLPFIIFFFKSNRKEVIECNCVNSTVCDTKEEDLILVKGISEPLIDSSLFNKSYHRCVGWDSWETRTCYFKNVCFINTTWYYIVDDYNENLVNQNDIKLSISPFTSDSKYHINPWKPTLINKKDIELDKYPIYNQLHFLYEAYNGENFGHVIGDELVPIYRALSIFSLQSHASQIQLIYHIPLIPQQGSCESDVMKSKETFRKNCERNYKTIPYLLTDYSLKRMRFDSKENFCISDLVAGIGMLTDHCNDPTVHGRYINEQTMCNFGLSHSTWEFRNHVVNRMVNTTKEANFTLTVLVREDGKRWPSNTQELLNITDSVALKWGIQLIIINRIDEMPIKRQVEIVASSAVLVTATGGSSFIGLFLPKGSSMLLISPKNSLLDFHFWEYISHTRVKFIQHEADDEERWKGHVNTSLFEKELSTSLEMFFMFK